MLTTIATLCFLTFISDITPGPNFWKIVHHSVFRSRKEAFIFASGLLTSSSLHCLMGFVGISALIAAFDNALLWIQILGGSYIAWYGIKMLLTQKKDTHQQTTGDTRFHSRTSKIWMDGVLTNFTNPKTILFYASLFAITLTPEQPPLKVLIILLCLLATSFLTNLMVATLFSLFPVRRFFQRWQLAINRVIGGMLVFAGIKIALQQRA